MKKWKIISEDELYYEIVDSEGQLVGYVAKFDEEYKEEEKLNLNLVLNAPEMLEMLERLKNHFGLFPIDREDIKELIDKITK